MTFDDFTRRGCDVECANRCRTQPIDMDDLTNQMRTAFASFSRPACVVIHPGDDCVDCPDVAHALANTDCDSLVKSDQLIFTTIPMDCMTVDAILHFLPAIAIESLHSDGLRVAETVAWMLGADEWDTDLTISEQIKPKLSSEQHDLIRQLLARLDQLPLSSHAVDQLAVAQECWHS